MGKMIKMLVVATVVMSASFAYGQGTPAATKPAAAKTTDKKAGKKKGSKKGAATKMDDKKATTPAK